MHEMSLAMGMEEIVRQELAKQPGARLLRLGVRIGEFAGVEPECIKACLEMLFQEPPVITAEIVFETALAEARCKACGQTFRPRRADFRCCHCGSAAVELLQGQSSGVEWMEIE